MRVWLPQFSLRRTELTSGLFGRLVGKPLQCCSRCRRGRAQHTDGDTHTHTRVRAGTCTNTPSCRAHNIRNINTCPRTLATFTLEREAVRSCIQMQAQIQMCRKFKKNSKLHTHTHTQIPISHPDGDRAAADVAGEAAALLAQVTCSEQLAQVRHSWELEPQGKCSCWLGGRRCVWQAGARLQVHRHHPQNGWIQLKERGWGEEGEFCHRRTEILNWISRIGRELLVLNIRLLLRPLSLMCGRGY